MSDLTDDRLTRRYNALVGALDDIVDHWSGAHHPPTAAGSGRHTPPTIQAAHQPRPPVRPRRSLARPPLLVPLVIEERDLTLGPRGNDGPDLALFLARHADWLSRHEAAEDATAELKRHAHRIEATALGRRTRRVVLGACPDPALDENGYLLGPCAGTLVAVVHDEDDLLPAVVRCDVDRDHAWAPSEWQALGRKLGRVSQSGAEALLQAIFTKPTHRVG